MSVRGVVGVAQSSFGGQPCIAVMVASETVLDGGQIPVELDGYIVRVVTTGEIEAR